MNHNEVKQARETLEAKIKAEQDELSMLKREEKSYNFVDNISLQPEVGIAFVKSESKATIYMVDIIKQTCNCPDHQYRGVVCKHIQAVMRLRQKTERVGIVN